MVGKNYLTLSMQESAVLGASNGGEVQLDELQDQKMPDHSGRGLQETARSSWVVSAFNSSVLFWIDTFFAPGVQV